MPVNSNLLVVLGGLGVFWFRFIFKETQKQSVTAEKLKTFSCPALFEIQFEIKGTEVIRCTHWNYLSLAEF